MKSPLMGLVIMFISLKPHECCEASRSSAEVVEFCPENERDWNEAALRKNCPSISQACRTSSLAYHCVPNHFLNVTIEVCAVPKFIVNGRCTEYNEGGGVIQANQNTNCGVFIENTCPLRYRSTDTYKYSDCYKLVVRPTSQSNTEGRDLILISSLSYSFSSTTVPITTSVRFDDDQDLSLPLALGISFLGIVLILLAIVLFVRRGLCRKKLKQKRTKSDTEEGSELKISDTDNV
ncbi:uncharacterized protein LOC133203924 [Saccostrea echinata]|uniref:uncharacterized protein LOC133203924 n=1 Tax=Saccostrea echinata TaxID=191078 RepID=UPI002A7F7A9E|nr:uncharacterized protein LOC133203924 [Saccostrea echinata]